MLAYGIVTVFLGTGTAFSPKKGNFSSQSWIFGKMSAVPDYEKSSVVSYPGGSEPEILSRAPQVNSNPFVLILDGLYTWSVF